MRAEKDCDLIRVEISARLDGEVGQEIRRAIDDHLATCSECRTYEASLAAVRQTMRVRAPEDDVPDMTAAVMRRVRETARPKMRLGGLARLRLRIAAVAAATMALVVFGASLPFTNSPPDIAAAAVSENVQNAARMLESYEASFDIVERGWHHDVGTRRFTAQVWYRAPEDIHVQVTDRTEYPSRAWPTNDYEMIANAERWWIEERSACPTQGLPACPRPYIVEGPIERRAVIDRQPFDGTTPLPTDIVVPFSTLASGSGVDVLGTTEIADRRALRVRLDQRRALPLVSALQVGGSWREFHPLDTVDIWLDSETWFPLRFEVRAGASPDRHLWALRRSLTDEPGGLLLQVTARSFDGDPALSDRVFDTPRSGSVRDGGFESLGATSDAVVDVPVGLRPYRAGRLGIRKIRTYTDGLTFLKVATTRRGDIDIAAEAEELETAVGFAYYLPATVNSSKRIDIVGRAHHLTLESNLPRDELIAIAATAEIRGHKAPDVLRRSGGTVVARSDPGRAFDRYSFAQQPRSLPPGYRAATAVVTTNESGNTTVVVYYRHTEIEFEGSGIRIAQSSDVPYLSPSSEEFVDVAVDGVVGRWSPERGELEWIDGDVYRAVAVPSGDLTTALRIANGMS